MPLACLAPEGLSSHVGTIRCSWSSPLLLLQSFILYCLPGKQTPKQSCLSKTQPGNSPTFSPFSEYTAVARHYLCIVSLQPSKPKLWFSCWKSSVPWPRDNYGHSSTRGVGEGGKQQSCSTIYQPASTHRRAASTTRDRENVILGWQQLPWNMPKPAAKKKINSLSLLRIRQEINELSKNKGDQAWL